MKSKNDLKIGDRVKVIFANGLIKTAKGKIINGAIGTVKDTSRFCFTGFIGVEFDDDIGGNTGNWNGKNGHCQYVFKGCLEKIEDTDEETKEETREEAKEETKVDTLTRKMLETLREEIGVDIGEEFDVYKKGNMLWRCKFERNEFFGRAWNGFQKSRFWKDLIVNFHDYTFKRKPFIPEYEEEYFFLSWKYDENNNIEFSVLHNIWVDDIVDYGTLALGNVFRSKEEAFGNKNKLAEKLEKLRKGEV